MRGDEVFVVICAMIAGVFVVKILANTVSRTICHWCDVSLKMRLVEAGMAPKEIEQVLLAGKKRKGWRQACKAAKAVEKEYKDYSYSA